MTSKDIKWKEPDFRVIGSNETVELKADSYKNPKNFFLEHYSSKESKSLGGPWRCEQENVPYLAYWFTGVGEWYLFEVPVLMGRLESIPLDKYSKEVPNRGYTTTGFAVPIKLVVDITTKHELVYIK